MDKQQTQQPVAWRHNVVEPDGSEGVMFSHGKDCPWVHWKDAYKAGCVFTVQPLYTAPPVPRDVLMAALSDLRDQCAHILDGYCLPADASNLRHDISDIDLAAIADRYASQVKPQSVNQQLLTALKPFALISQEGVIAKATGHVTVTTCAEYFHRASEVSTAAELSGNSGQLPAAEAAQPVVQDGYAQGVEAVAKMLEKKADDFASENGYDDMGSLSFGGNLNGELMRDYHSGLLELAEEVRAMKTDCQHPAIAKTVAVPEGARHWAYRHYGSEPQKGYTIVSRAAGATHGGTPVAYLGDGELAGDAVQAICEAHNAALAAVAVPDEIDADKAPWAPAEMEPDIAYADGWNACRAAMLSAAQKGGAA